jgi:hypothetical protein
MTSFYNLDAILSIGYRVNSKNATQFRPDSYRDGQTAFSKNT